MAYVAAEIAQYVAATRRVCFGDKAFDHLAQMAPVCFHGFRIDAMNLDQLMVVAIHERAILVEYIGKATGHAGTKIDAGLPQHADQPTGHILAAVIPGSFNHRMGAGVAYRETLSGTAGGKQLATSGAIQAGVTNNRGLVTLEPTALGRYDDNFAAIHAFTHVVVGISFQVKVQAACIPYAKALPGHTAEAQRDRSTFKARFRVTPGNLARSERRHRAIPVADGEGKFSTALVSHGLLESRQHFPILHAGIVWHIALDPTELGCASRDKVIVQQRRKVQLALGGGVTFEHFQQVGTANQVGQLAHAKHGQNFAHLFGNEAEIVLDHLYGATEMLVTQILVLRGNPGSTVIEMTDAQVRS